MTPLDRLTFVVVRAAGALHLVEKGREWRAPSDLEALKQEYAAGRIDEVEFEQRMDLLVDERNEQLCETVERVNGVRPSTIAQLVHRFESVDEFRRADREGLRGVVDVGPENASAVLNRLRELLGDARLLVLRKSPGFDTWVC